MATSEIRANRTSETPSLGRMTSARIRRAVERPNEVELWCKDYHVTVIKDENGVPIKIRSRCKNRECCVPKHDTIALHEWDIVTGEYVTRYEPAHRGR